MRIKLVIIDTCGVAYHRDWYVTDDKSLEYAVDNFNNRSSSYSRADLALTKQLALEELLSNA